jgi:hypothetical protein
MTFEEGKIYTFKMNSGEEIVAKVNGVAASNYVTITDPVSIAPSHQGMGLIPSLFTGNPEKSVMININSIAMYTETDETIQTKYIQATTGISVPDKKLILG